jgi:L-alanine-DL-glutamate epimerase-like enolase superfamily enzyme
VTVQIRIRDVQLGTEEYRYRTTMKFGGMTVDRVTLLNAHVTIEDAQGRVTTGFGSMPLGNVWAYPSRTLSYDETLAAMRSVADEVAMLYRSCPLRGHPIDITHTLEPEFPKTIPALASLVAASPIDAALHDAFGKHLGLNAFQTLTPDLLPHDLGHYLGPEFHGLRFHDFVRKTPQPSLPLYHLVGALDALTPADIITPVGDGLPEHLGQWIKCDGLTHLKIKLNGDDATWDYARIVGVHEVAQTANPAGPWSYSLDFNERCASVDDLLELLERLQADTPLAFERVQYIEQPSTRDLHANPANTMHAAAKLKPVVIDESLVDLASLKLARDLGYTGVAFKACKGQTQSLLLAAAAQHYGMFRCVQDLTCPGASLIHSAGLAAHIPSVVAIEANARQYCPAANTHWQPRIPGLFTIRNGVMPTSQLTGPGLGAVQ